MIAPGQAPPGAAERLRIVPRAEASAPAPRRGDARADADPAAKIEARALSKGFAEVSAVAAVSLAVRNGEFLVLLGPSGSGKSTLLRMIAGLETPSSGDVLIDGAVVTDLAPRSRNVAMVFQSYALYPHLTVFENIAFPLRARGVRGRALERRVLDASAAFGLEPLLRRKPRQLSGGERQRVALVRAIVREPTVLLLDEPLSNLDAQLRATAREELREFQRRVGTTAIYVTHDQVEAMALGDRIAVLDRGALRQVGSPHEIYEDPADTFVATFIGSPPMNLVRTAGALLGVRPEHLLPRTHFAAAEPITALPVRVGRVEYLGADRLAYGTLDDPWPHDPVVVRWPSTIAAALRAGERQQLFARDTDLKRFDPGTGRRAQ
ncbi:MAG: ABC transporter ATP-binding protein [Burkholderiales bacterium]